MRVIGAGFGRTGTLSLKTALDELGLGPCYHMTEAMQQPEHKRLWTEAADGGADWDVLFDGYQSTVDWPGCYFWRELVREYPDAKVILTNRDPDKWYESTRTTIYQFGTRLAPLTALFPFGRGMARLSRTLIWDGTFDGRFADKAYAIEVYRRHLREVIEEVPADRLLVFDVSQGWEPLCAFLGVDVPDRPFPHVNDRAEMQARIRQVYLAGGAVAAAGAGLVAAAIVLARRRRF